MKSNSLKIRTGVTAIAFAAGGSVAMAQDIFSDLYVSGGLGVNFLDDITLTPSNTTLNQRVLDFQTGFVGSVALGTRIGQHARVEGEFSYRQNDLDGVTIQNEGPQNFSGGEATAFAVMLNGWFDIPVGPGNVTPYVGGGIGGAEVSIDATTLSSGPCLSVGSCEALTFDGSEFVFAGQLGAGVAIGAPGGLQLTIDYRYFHADGIDVPYTSTGFGPGTAGSTDYQAHSIMIGGRMPIGGP